MVRKHHQELAELAMLSSSERSKLQLKVLDADKALELLGAYLDGHKDAGDQWMLYDAYGLLMRVVDGDVAANAFLPPEEWEKINSRYVEFCG